MAGADDKVMTMVEREVKKNRDVGSSELYEKAKQLDAQIGKLTLRQFHAKYPLQVKRRLASSTKPKAKKPARKPRKAKASKARRQPRKAASPRQATDRDAVRRVFLSFAKELAAADDQGAVVGVIAKLDTYVDRVVKASNRG